MKKNTDITAFQTEKLIFALIVVLFYTRVKNDVWKSYFD